MTTPSISLMTICKEALKASREWTQRAASNTLAARDLRMIDGAITLLEKEEKEPDLTTGNAIDEETLNIVTRICPRLGITHPQQVAKVQVALIEAIKTSRLLGNKEIIDG